MATKTGAVVILDANVLYPASLRSFLLYLASNEIFQPKWTMQINEEWHRHLFNRLPDLTVEKLQGITDQMNRAFPDALVSDFENIIDSLSLPDVNDRHVLAAAIKANAHFIITCNIKDFPSDVLAVYNLKAITPDEWVMRLLDQDPMEVVESFLMQVRSLKYPPKTEKEVIASFEKCGMKKTSAMLRLLVE